MRIITNFKVQRSYSCPEKRVSITVRGKQSFCIRWKGSGERINRTLTVWNDLINDKSDFDLHQIRVSLVEELDKVNRAKLGGFVRRRAI